MNKIKCTHCGKDIELIETLTKDIQDNVIAEEHQKHLAEIEQVRKDTEAKARLDA